MFSLFSYFNNRGDKMESRIDEFREFVKKYPLIKEDVKNNKRTWQSFYEDWVLLGENDGIWDPLRERLTSRISLWLCRCVWRHLVSTAIFPA